MAECPTSAQVIISQSVGSSPVSVSVLTAQSLEPAWDSVSPSLSAPPLLMLCLSLSLKNKQTLKKLKNIHFAEYLALEQHVSAVIINMGLGIRKAWSEY